jgi:hypothetical protein
MVARKYGWFRGRRKLFNQREHFTTDLLTAIAGSYRTGIISPMGSASKTKGGLVEGREGVGEKLHFSQEREKWGTRPLFSDRATYQFLEPPRQKTALWFLLRQGERLFIRSASLSCPAEPAVHICTG